jgi:hypothetical protein
MSIRNKKEPITDQMSIALANALSDHNKPPFELSKIAKDFLVDYYVKFDKTFYEARYHHSYYDFVFYMWRHLNLENLVFENHRVLGERYRVEYEPWWIDQYH